MGRFFLFVPKVEPRAIYALKTALMLQLAREGCVTRRHKHGQGLSSLILSRWGSIIEGTSERCISNEEIQELY